MATASTTSAARLAPSAPREIATVFRYELQSLLFSPRTLLPMLIYAGFSVLSMLVFSAAANKARDAFSSAEQAEQAPSGAVDLATSEIVGQVLEFTGWGTKGDAAEMVRDHVPLVVVFFFALASYFLPLLVALVSFDQFSELSTRGARFALLRVRRDSYVAGKALAAVAAVAGFLLVMWAIVIAVGVWRGGAEISIHAVREGLRAWALMSVLALPYLSITAVISSRARPGVAFLATFGAFIGLSIGSTLVTYVLPWALRKGGLETLAEQSQRLLVIFPWSHAPNLVSRWTPTVAQGVGALVVLAAIGYALTIFSVRRRDV